MMELCRHLYSAEAADTSLDLRIQDCMQRTIYVPMSYHLKNMICVNQRDGMERD